MKCECVTQAGYRCSFKAKEGSRFCKKHKVCKNLTPSAAYRTIRRSPRFARTRSPRRPRSPIRSHMACPRSPSQTMRRCSQWVRQYQPPSSSLIIVQDMPQPGQVPKRQPLRIQYSKQQPSQPRQTPKLPSQAPRLPSKLQQSKLQLQQSKIDKNLQRMFYSILGKTPQNVPLPYTVAQSIKLLRLVPKYFNDPLTLESIGKQRNKLGLTLHPDRCQPQKKAQCNEKFQELSELYDFLQWLFETSSNLQ